MLNILNLGGVMGKALSWNKDYVTSPVQVKVLGSIFLNDTPSIFTRIQSHLKCHVA